MLLAALPALVLLAAPTDPPAERVPEALREAYAQGHLQESYPAAVDLQHLQPAEAAVDPVVALLRWLGLGGVAAQLLRLLGIGAAIVAVVLAAVWIAGKIAERSQEASLTEGVAAPTLDAGPLLDAEALAAQGRFGEAIHLLLLGTFEVLARRMGSRLAPGMTAREALAHLTLPAPARPAMADLVDAVETTTFAGHAASESDYVRCAEHFTLLRSTLAGAHG